MILGLVIVIMPVISLVYAALSGNMGALSAAALDGASESVKLCINLCGMICFWQAIMEVMRDCGLSDALSSLLRPLLSKLFPSASRDRDTMNSLSTNVSANLLGLGNAATPAGIKAAIGLQKLSGSLGASNELCLLVILNTASIQLIPTTVASLRAVLGSASPFEILPAVWLTSICSVSAGLLSAKGFEHIGRRHE